MRWTFRIKMLGIVGITTLAFLLLLGTGALTATRIERQLTTIYRRYLPKLELAPELHRQFEHLRRGFQDAVASGDNDTLAGTRSLVAQFLSDLDAARSAVDPADDAALRAALEDYEKTAYDVSRRLIGGETGEALVAEMADMQAKQFKVDGLIDRAATLDRQELTQAFDSAGNAAKKAVSYQLGISIACAASALVLSLFLSRSVLRTVRDLTEGFSLFGSGDFSRPIPVESNDELGVVIRHANQMAASLAALARERDEAESALKLANRELEAFSYSVAHDLRAPLRGINGFSRALLEDSRDKLDDESKHYLDRIAGAAHKMGELIDALLTLSRVTRADLHREVVDLSAMAQTIISQLRSGEPDRAVSFVNHERIIASGDQRLLRAALENLIGNAWKFTSRSAASKIELGCVKKDGEAVYFVRDNGAGFDEAYAGKLFAPFQRLHSESEFTGTGIGLATVQRIVHRHGGRIWAQGAVGQGATFFFTLEDSTGEIS